MATIMGGRQRIFLTMVGGGAFGNEVPAILEAIKNAHLEWTRHTQSQIKKVTLVLYSIRKEVVDWLPSLVNAGIPVSYTIYKNGVAEPQPIPQPETSKK